MGLSRKSIRKDVEISMFLRLDFRVCNPLIVTSSHVDYWLRIIESENREGPVLDGLKK